jgi:hypothetical protein
VRFCANLDAAEAIASWVGGHVPRLRSKAPTHGADLLSTMPFMTLSIVSSMEISRPKGAVAKPNVVSGVSNSDELGRLAFNICRHRAGVFVER